MSGVQAGVPTLSIKFAGYDEAVCIVPYGTVKRENQGMDRLWTIGIYSTDVQRLVNSCPGDYVKYTDLSGDTLEEEGSIKTLQSVFESAEFTLKFPQNHNRSDVKLAYSSWNEIVSESWSASDGQKFELECKEIQ